MSHIRSCNCAMGFASFTDKYSGTRDGSRPTPPGNKGPPACLHPPRSRIPCHRNAVPPMRQ
eukprot:813898-Pyramimonas_sp.AAC.1